MKLTRPVKYNTVQELYNEVGKHFSEEWLYLYPSIEFRERELARIFFYYKRDNPQRTPRDMQNWYNVISAWYAKNWNKFKIQMEKEKSFDAPRDPKRIVYPQAEQVIKEMRNEEYLALSDEERQIKTEEIKSRLEVIQIK